MNGPFDPTLDAPGDAETVATGRSGASPRAAEPGRGSSTSSASRDRDSAACDRPDARAPSSGAARYPDEAALVESLRRADEAAYTLLVETFGPRLLALARRYLPQEADAEDALQEAFVLVFRSIDRFEGQSRLATWLHRIVVNCALMRIRARSRRPDGPLDADAVDGMTAGRRAAHKGSSVSEPAARAEVVRRVRDGLERLPDEYRMVLRLRDVEGLPLREVASLLDIGVSSAKSRLHRGRQALREILGPVIEGAV